MKIFSLFICGLLLSIRLYCQEDKALLILDKCLYDSTIDISLLQKLKNDTNFILKYFRSNNKDSSFAFDIHSFFLKKIPLQEKANTIKIEFIKIGIPGKKIPFPSFSFTFSSNKIKDAKRKFKELDKKVSKITTNRKYGTVSKGKKIASKVNKNEIQYDLPRHSFPNIYSIRLTRAIYKDNKVRGKYCVVSVNFLE